MLPPGILDILPVLAGPFQMGPANSAVDSANRILGVAEDAVQLQRDPTTGAESLINSIGSAALGAEDQLTDLHTGHN
jgi:hypothetical protein